MKGHWREAGLVLLLTAAALAVFFYPAVWQSRLIYCGDLKGSDLLEMNIPRRALAAQAVVQGEMPLWEPHLGNGLPLLAEGQAGVFYPLTLPLYLAFSLTAATNLSILLTLFIALLGGYAWARSYDISPPAAFFCALGYGLGGDFVFRLKHLNMIQVIAWLPCCLALIRAYWQQRRLIYLLALTAVLSWQVLAGHPHVTYICWLTCYLYAFALYFEFSKSEPSILQKGLCYRLLGKMTVCTVAALLLSSVQLLPTMDFVQASTRGSSKTWDYLYRYPFKLSHLKRMVSPYCFDNPALAVKPVKLQDEGIFWESAPYIGLIPLVLSGIGVCKLLRRSALIIVVLASIFLWGAFGPQGGLYWLFWKMCPGFGLFRIPARLLIPFQCFLALLAAFGAQTLADWLKRRFNSKVSASVLVVLVFFTGADLFCVHSAYLEYLPAAWEEKPRSWRLIEKEAQRVFAPNYMVSGNEMLKSGWKGGADKLLRHTMVLNPDLAAIWGVFCHSDHIVFEGGIEFNSYFNIQTAETCQCLCSRTADGRLQWQCTEDMYDWLRMQNVSHLLSFYPFTEDNNIANVTVMDDPVFPEGKLYIYRLRDTLPWLRLLPASEVTSDQPLFIRQLADKLPSAALIDSLYEKHIGCSDSAGTVRITESRRTRWQAEVNCTEPGYLFIAVNFDHNWRAYREDGSRVPIVRFNHAYQAIPLEPGRHRLTVKYESEAFAWGWKISLLAWLALLSSAVYLGRFGRR